MGWQKDEIEALAKELDIDAGGSLSQQDRLRYISRQVGMNDFNGLSNDDTDELQRRLEERRMQNETNSNNNSSNRANSGSNLSNRSNSFNNRRNFGKNSDSGVSNSLRKNNINRNSRRQSLASNNKKNNSFSSEKKKSNSLISSGGNFDVNDESKDSESGVVAGEVTIKIPMAVKISIIGTIVGVAVFVFLIFSVIAAIFGLEVSSSASAPQDPPCTKVKVKYCRNKETNEIVTKWSDVPKDYESGEYFSVNDCIIEEVEMDFEKYIERVVAGEVGVLKNHEVYKALAVAARTYAFNNIKDCSIRSSTKNQFVLYGEASAEVKKAVDETHNEVLLTMDESKENGVTLASPIEYDAFKCVNKDDEYYYMSQPTYDDAGADEGDKIPIEWVHKNVTYYMRDGEVPCAPVGTGTIGGHGRGMSQYGALYYMEVNPDATYTDILMHYYGKRIVIFSCDVFDDIENLDKDEIQEKFEEFGEDVDLDVFSSAYKSCEILGNLTN